MFVCMCVCALYMLGFGIDAYIYIHVIYICRWRLSVLLQHECGRSRRCGVAGCWVAVVGGARRSKHVYHFKVVRMQSIRDHVLIARLYCCDGGSNAPSCLTELRPPARLSGCSSLLTCATVMGHLPDCRFARLHCILNSTGVLLLC